MSISSRNEAAIQAAAARLGGQTLGTAVDVKSADATSSTGHSVTIERFGGVDLLFANGGGPPAGPALSFDDAAWQDAANLLLFSDAADGARRRALDEGARRRRDPRLHLLVGQGADPEPRALDRAARVGVGAGQDARARARGRRESASTRSSPAGSTPIASASSTRSTARSRASRPLRRKPNRLAAIPLGRYGEADEFGRVGAFLLSNAACYITGATVQVDGGLIKSVL